MGIGDFLLEEDALLVILVVNQPQLFSSWHFAPLISDIRLDLAAFHSWSAMKVSRNANLRVHILAK